MRDVFGVNPKIMPEPNANAFRAYIYSKKLAQDIAKLGVESPKTDSVTMPYCGNTLESRSNFAKGCMDTDGSVYTKRNKQIVNYPIIFFSSKSKELANKIFEIFLESGLNAKFNGAYIKEKRIRYMVRIYGFKQLKKFNEVISFNHPAKKKLAEDIALAGPIRR